MQLESSWVSSFLPLFLLSQYLILLEVSYSLHPKRNAMLDASNYHLHAKVYNLWFWHVHNSIYDLFHEYLDIKHVISWVSHICNLDFSNITFLNFLINCLTLLKFESNSEPWNNKVQRDNYSGTEVVFSNNWMIDKMLKKNVAFGRGSICLLILSVTSFSSYCFNRFVNFLLC